MLCQLQPVRDPRLLVGLDTSDDAGVYQLDDHTALIQTLDFFTPIVDDPYLFGQIAAANSLSDVYAMGGRPLTAMNIVAFPMCLGGDVLLAILKGGQDKVQEAGAIVVGGHSIEDKEPKFGLSITGIVHPGKVLSNAKAKPGDALVLTKGLGTGILMTASQAGMFETGVAAAIESMRTLNKDAAEVMAHYPVHSCTDITGFGLLGHIYEMASASRVDVIVNTKALPMLPEAPEAAAMGFVPAGAYGNRNYLQTVTFADTVPENIKDICFDPQTSGGLLISLPQGQALLLAAELQRQKVAAAVIGEVKTTGKGEIYVY